MSVDLSNLKPGDKVWVGTNNFPNSKILPIYKMTRTQVVLRPNGPGSAYEQRFKIDGGWRIGGYMMADNITGIPDAYEITEYDRKQEIARVKRELEEAEQKRIDGLRAEIANLFPDYLNASVSECSNRWTIEFSGLTESDARELAERINHGALCQNR
jgi:hypothetical protein